MTYVQADRVRWGAIDWLAEPGTITPLRDAAALTGALQVVGFA